MFSCNSKKELPTVQNLEIEKYAGTWYEIAKLPNSFEKNLECVSATYSLQDDGKIAVFNKGKKTNGDSAWKTIKGSAKIPDSNEPGRLKVTFFWPFAGDYYVIDLADDYSYALVGSPDRKYLWILSRETTLNKAIYSRLVERAKELEFPVELIERMNQSCESQKDG